MAIAGQAEASGVTLKALSVPSDLPLMRGNLELLALVLGELVGRDNERK
jgi:hypothetical protein